MVLNLHRVIDDVSQVPNESMLPLQRDLGEDYKMEASLKITLHINVSSNPVRIRYRFCWR
jgi:hypothetical protein